MSTAVNATHCAVLYAWNLRFVHTSVSVHHVFGNRIDEPPHGIYWPRSSIRASLTQSQPAMFSTLLAAVAAAVLLLPAYYIVPILWSIVTSPLRHLPGPPNDSLFWGNFKRIREADDSVLQDQWVAQYGSTISFRGLFGVRASLSGSCFVYSPISAGVASVDSGY